MGNKELQIENYGNGLQTTIPKENKRREEFSLLVWGSATMEKIQEYKNEIEKNPNKLKPYFNLVVLYIRMKNYSEARDWSFPLLVDN